MIARAWEKFFCKLKEVSKPKYRERAGEKNQYKRQKKQRCSNKRRCRYEPSCTWRLRLSMCPRPALTHAVGRRGRDATRGRENQGRRKSDGITKGNSYAREVADEERRQKSRAHGLQREGREDREISIIKSFQEESAETMGGTQGGRVAGRRANYTGRIGVKGGEGKRKVNGRDSLSRLVSQRRTQSGFQEGPGLSDKR